MYPLDQLQQSVYLSELSVFVYDSTSGSVPEGWTRIDSAEDGSFAAAAYQNNITGVIIIAYRGSNDLGDWTGANTASVLGRWNSQFSDALDYAYKITHNPLYEDATILTTGHSLGGLLAQIAAQMFGLNGAGFDPAAGAASLVQLQEFQTLATQYGIALSGEGIGSNFVNYNVTNSLVSGRSGQLGNVQNIAGLDYGLGSFVWDFFLKGGAVGVLADYEAN